MRESLGDIAKEIEVTGKPKRMRVRRLLAIVGQERRGKHVVRALRRLLRRHQLKCDPDFANVHIDSQVSVTLGPKLGRPPREAVLQDEEPIEPTQLLAEESPAIVVDTDEEIQPHISIDIEDETDAGELISANEIETSEETSDLEEREVVITIRQGIPAGSRPPILVRGNQSVHHALTHMIDQNVGQLVVANGDRARVEGIFSWQSYGQAILAGREPQLIGDCISQNFAEVNEERPLFDAVREVIRHGVVVVRSRENKLCGLVTQRDVAAVFVDLAEPFLFLGQIENHLRELVQRMRLSREQLQLLADERDSERAGNAACVDDLTLGELIRAIQNPQFWDRLGFRHDRAILLNRLERVRRIRNRVMHFDADGISTEDKAYLKETRRILQEL